MSDQLKEKHPDLYTTLFAFANTPPKDVDWDDRIKSWQIMAKIIDITNGIKIDTLDKIPNETDIEIAVNKVQGLLQEGRAIDAATFNGLVFVFEDYNPVTQDAIKSKTSNASKFLSVASIPAMIYPPAAGVLQAASVFVGDLLPYLSTPRLNLSVSPFPRELGYFDLLELDNAIFSHIIDKYNKDPALQKVFSRLSSDKAIKINLNVHSSELLKSLPEEQQNIFEWAATNPESSSTEFIGLMDVQLKKIEEQIDNLEASIKEEKDELKKKELMLNRERDYQRARSEFASTLSLASMVLNPISPELGRGIEKFGAAALQLLDLTKLAKTPGSIGPIALINGYATALTLMIDIIGIGGGPDPFQSLVVESLQRVERSVQELRKEVRFRFQIIEQRQIEILINIEKVIHEVREKYIFTENRLEEIKNYLKEGLEINRDERRTELTKAINRAKNRIALGRSAYESEDITDILADIITYTTRIAGEISFISYLENPAKLSDLPKKVQSRMQVDLLFGLFPSIANLLQLKFPDDLKVVNPIEWAIGAQKYLELCIAARPLPNKLIEVGLSNIYIHGQWLREITFLLLSKKSLIRSKNLYAKYAGVTLSLNTEDKGFQSNFPSPNVTPAEVIKDILKEFNDQKLHKWIKPKLIAINELSQNSFVYQTNNDSRIADYHRSSEFDFSNLPKILTSAQKNDPFLTAVSLGLIRLKNVFRADPFVYSFTSAPVARTSTSMFGGYYYVWKIVPRDKIISKFFRSVPKLIARGTFGAELDSKYIKTPILLEQNELNWLSKSWAVYHPNGEYLSSFEPVLDACYKAVREYDAALLKSKEFEDYLNEKFDLLRKKGVLKQFEIFGSMCQLLIALASWCHQSDGVQNPESFKSAPRILWDKSSMVDYILKCIIEDNTLFSVKRQVRRVGGWEGRVIELVNKKILADLKLIEEYADRAGEEGIKSTIPVVDQQIRQILSFAGAHRISLSTKY